MGHVRIGVLCGLLSERDALALPASIPVVVSGARPDVAQALAERLVADGATALLSVGLAGALDPALRPGALIVPQEVLDTDGALHQASGPLAASLGMAITPGRIAGADEVVATVPAKARLRAATGAAAVDMESHRLARVAARHGLPFIAVRAIADPADGTIPPAARDSIRSDGSVDVAETIRQLARRPGDLPALIRLGRESAMAHKRLRELGRQLRNVLESPV